MKKLLLLSLFLAAFTSNAQIEWTEQSTNYPVSGSYTGDVAIVDENIAWSMVQRVTATNHQRFSKTSDGGITWTTGAINVGNTTGLGIGNITAADSDTAWVSVFPVSTALGTQGIYKTTNGGTTWTKQTTAAFTSASFCNFVYFWDANNGVCMGDKRGGYFEIYTTTNGGTNWTRTPSANIASTSTDYSYTGKYFVTGNTVWFGTDNGELMRSTDRGLNWTAITTPVPDFGGGTDTTSVAEFAFSDNNHGFILKETYDASANFLSTTLYRTDDGGANWDEVSVTSGSIFHGSIAFAGPGVLLTAGSSTDNFGSAYSLDNGASWTAIDEDSHTTLNIKDATTGYSGGFASGGTGGIFKLSNTLGTPSFATSKFKVFPNPATSNVTISTVDIDSYKLSVTDLTGKVVMTKSLSGIENHLDISALSTGAYFFELSSNNKKEVVKVLKN
ncbi:MAG: T9SS type A sorting domain-containing protein [Flavobacterium sp.]